MNQKENDIHDLQQMANDGWLQMNELLKKEGLSDEKPVVIDNYKKIYFITVLAACILALIIFSPFHLSKTNKNIAIINSTKNNYPTSKENKTTLVSPINKTDGRSTLLQQVQKKSENIDLSNSRIKWIPAGNPDQKKLELALRNTLQKKHQIANIERLNGPEINSYSVSPLISTANSFASEIVKTKNKKQKSGTSKIKWYVGAGSNISSINGNFDFTKLNVHPSVRFIIPFNKKVSLHSGFYAISVIHSKQASNQEKEEINNINANLLYKINTTSIIKASYFDLPITFHYQLSKNWSAGAGFQLSKLYKVKVKEKEESFDYNNNLIESNTLRYNMNATGLVAASPKKVEIKNFEERLVVETTLKQGSWLFSAGYYYGFNKSITLQESNGDKQLYRNQYLKLGIQYKLNKKP